MRALMILLGFLAVPAMALEVTVNGVTGELVNYQITVHEIKERRKAGDLLYGLELSPGEQLLITQVCVKTISRNVGIALVFDYRKVKELPMPRGSGCITFVPGILVKSIDRKKSSHPVLTCIFTSAVETGTCSVLGVRTKG